MKLNSAKLALALGAAFLVLLAGLHVIEPEFAPSWRMISEYELGRHGWLMSLAFFCWGGGFLALAISAWRMLTSVAGNIAKWWLVIISIALFGAGIFYPQPITDMVRGSTDKLHATCGMIMIFTLPFAAILFVKSLINSGAFLKFRLHLFLLTLLVWVGLLTFIIASAVYQPKDRMYGPQR